MDSYFREIVDPGDRASAYAKEVCFASFNNCPGIEIVPVEPGNFRGAVDFVPREHLIDDMRRRKLALRPQNDGAGGKPQFHTLLGDPAVFRQAGWEIITMNADDISRSGGFPAVIANEFNAKRITDQNFHLYHDVMDGYGEALAETGLVNITGETAIMKHSITAFCDVDPMKQLIFTWGGTCFGFSRPEFNIMPKKTIRHGMVVLGFWEPGYRCNGGTFFTNVIMHKWGPDPREIMANEDARRFVQKLVVPSLSYSNTITRILGWNRDGSEGQPLARIAGIAHITGGGVWGKFREILPEGVGAVLGTMPEPAEVLLEGQMYSKGTPFELSDLDAYGTLHGGCGMLVVCETESDAQAVIKEAAIDRIEAQVVGKTVKSASREVRITSRFRERRVLSSEELRVA